MKRTTDEEKGDPREGMKKGKLELIVHGAELHRRFCWYDSRRRTRSRQEELAPQERAPTNTFGTATRGKS